jgi:ATP-dependent Clp endopeptidase proteolytic subunit ClpP
MELAEAVNDKFSKEQLYVCENDIYFNGDINTTSMSLLSNELVKLENKIVKESRKLKKKIDDLIRTDKELSSQVFDGTVDYCEIEFNVKYKPIRLFITSNGGAVYQVMAVYDLIRNLRVPVYTICKGNVASAGTILSLAGKKRYITENAYMLIHQLSSGSWGKFNYLNDMHENYKNLMEHIKRIYLENTKMSSEELDDILKRDLYWSASKCLEKGLVDEIMKNE